MLKKSKRHKGLLIKMFVSRSALNKNEEIGKKNGSRVLKIKLDLAICKELLSNNMKLCILQIIIQMLLQLSTYCNGDHLFAKLHKINPFSSDKDWNWKF